MTSPIRSSPLALTVLGLLHTRPLHPYGLQRLIKEWGKDQVVNVGQRASLYRTIDRLHTAGLVAVRETERDQQYPERTVYEITEAGRAATREWLEEMLSVPKREFPEFPVALSHILMLTPQEALPLLEKREAALSATFNEMQAAMAATQELPRVVLLESEYALATAGTQLEWVRSVINDLRNGSLTWDHAELLPLAESSAASAEAIPRQ